MAVAAALIDWHGICSCRSDRKYCGRSSLLRALCVCRVRQAAHVAMTTVRGQASVNQPLRLCNATVVCMVVVVRTALAHT